MVNEEKVKQMTKLAIYEKEHGRSKIAISRCYRWDYVSIQAVKTWIFASVSYAMLCGVILGSNLFDITDIFLDMGAKVSAIYLFIMYIVFCMIFLLIGFVVYNVRYTSSLKSVLKYNEELMKLYDLYVAEEEALQEPSVDIEDIVDLD